MNKCRICDLYFQDQDMAIEHGKRGTKCYNCKREYDRIYYNNKTKEEKKKKYNKQQERYKNNKIYFYNYLLNHPCVDCGESDPIVLEFDHLRDKEFNISNNLHRSIENILKEIDKCEVRCANCHKRKTAKQFGFYNYILVQDSG